MPDTPTGIVIAHTEQASAKREKRHVTWETCGRTQQEHVMWRE